MPTVRSYIRTSQKSQESSLDTQNQLTSNYAIDTDFNVIFYQDHGVSGDSNLIENSNLIKLLLDLQIGDILVVTATDRLTRSRFASELILMLLFHKKCKLVDLRHEFDIYTEEGVKHYRKWAEFAQMEHKEINIRQAEDRDKGEIAQSYKLDLELNDVHHDVLDKFNYLLSNNAFFKYTIVSKPGKWRYSSERSTEIMARWLKLYKEFNWDKINNLPAVLDLVIENDWEYLELHSLDNLALIWLFDEILEIIEVNKRPFNMAYKILQVTICKNWNICLPIKNHIMFFEELLSNFKEYFVANSPNVKDKNAEFKLLTENDITTICNKYLITNVDSNEIHKIMEEYAEKLVKS